MDPASKLHTIDDCPLVCLHSRFFCVCVCIRPTVAELAELVYVSTRRPRDQDVTLDDTRTRRGHDDGFRPNVTINKNVLCCDVCCDVDTRNGPYLGRGSRSSRADAIWYVPRRGAAWHWRVVSLSVGMIIAVVAPVLSGSWHVIAAPVDD